MKTASLIVFLLAILTASAQQDHETRRVNEAVLKNAGKTGEEWLTYGLTPGETRYSPLNQINATNVGRLGLAWSYDVGPGGGNQEATPLVFERNIYAITNWSIVFAVDARTGKERWRWDPKSIRTAVFPKICCGVVNRGIAIYQSKIIAPIIDGRLEALDAETGKAVWESRVAYPQENYTITMAPRIAKGKVIIGAAGCEYPCADSFPPSMPIPDSSNGSSIRFRAIRRRLRKCCDEESRRDMGWRVVETRRRRLACGTAWPMIPRPTCSMSAPVTVARGRRICGSRRAKKSLRRFNPGH